MQRKESHYTLTFRQHAAQCFLTRTGVFEQKKGWGASRTFGICLSSGTKSSAPVANMLTSRLKGGSFSSSPAYN